LILEISVAIIREFIIKVFIEQNENILAIKVREAVAHLGV
jgi:hypothetical protein